MRHKPGIIPHILPKTWEWITLESINNRKPKSITPSKFPNQEFEIYSVPTFPTGKPEILKGKEIKSGKQEVSLNEVLICKINPRINRVWIVGKKKDLPQIASTEWIVVKTPYQVDPLYLLRVCQSNYFRNLLTSNVSGVGGSLTRARPKEVLKYPIPLPPLAEQKRIVAKLDTLMGHVERSKEQLAKVPALLKAFRQSVLAQAVSGQLTEDWREGKEYSIKLQPPIQIDLPKETKTLSKWSWNKLIKLAKLESGHTPRKSVLEYWKDGDIPWISLQDIRAAHGKVIYQTKYMPTQLGIDNSSARLLPKGTVCFSRDISVGFVTIMGKPMSTTQHFANWIVDINKLDNKYLMYCFMASKDSLIGNGQGTTVKTIYMPALKKMYLLTPPLQEQKEIVKRVEALFAKADTIEAQYQAAQEHLETLPQALLAKAFRGELVEQDPSDEPARELLARIQAEQAALALEKKKGKKKKK